MQHFCCIDTLTDAILYVVSENGVTPAGFDRLEEEDFEGLGLSIIGKKFARKALKEAHTEVQILLTITTKLVSEH